MWLLCSPLLLALLGWRALSPLTLVGSGLGPLLAGWGSSALLAPLGLVTPAVLAIAWGALPALVGGVWESATQAIRPWLAWRTGGLVLLITALDAGLGRVYWALSTGGGQAPSAAWRAAWRILRQTRRAA